MPCDSSGFWRICACRKHPWFWRGTMDLDATSLAHYGCRVANLQCDRGHWFVAENSVGDQSVCCGHYRIAADTLHVI